MNVLWVYDYDRRSSQLVTLLSTQTMTCSVSSICPLAMLWPTAAWKSITSALNDKHSDSLLNKEDQLLMRTTGEETASTAAWQQLKTLFIHLNTSLPASAVCERVFRCAGLTMNSHCTCMSDKLFEQLSVIQGEQAFVQSAMISTHSPILTTHTACQWWRLHCYWHCNLLTVCADHCMYRND